MPEVLDDVDGTRSSLSRLSHPSHVLGADSVARPVRDLDPTFRGATGADAISSSSSFLSAGTTPRVRRRYLPAPTLAAVVSFAQSAHVNDGTGFDFSCRLHRCRCRFRRRSCTTTAEADFPPENAGRRGLAVVGSFAFATLLAGGGSLAAAAGHGGRRRQHRGRRCLGLTPETLPVPTADSGGGS